MLENQQRGFYVLLCKFLLRKYNYIFHIRILLKALANKYRAMCIEELRFGSIFRKLRALIQVCGCMNNQKCSTCKIQKKYFTTPKMQS